MQAGSNAWTEEGHKTLAAIVFTDVVGFARHANVNEQRALANLHRDISIMREVCDRTGGAVLKTMGDGVLMRFPSAMNAIQCALELQRILHEQALRLDHQDVLVHRIGVHLGDVVTTASDVYGDGVNVAARLQAEARPGSIFLSRTVYDVVKGKVKFAAKYLGPRHLKGISEPVGVWEVPPIVHQEIDRRNKALDSMMVASGMSPDHEERNPKVLGLIAASILILVAGTVMFVSFNGARQRASQNAIRDRQSSYSRPRQDPPKTGAKGDAPAPVEPSFYQDSAFAGKLKDLFDDCDFQGMISTLQATNYATTTEGMEAIKRYGDLDQFMGWLKTNLANTSKDDPLTIPDGSDGDNPILVYMSTPGVISMQTPTSTSPHDLTGLPKIQLAQLATAILSRASTNPADRPLIEDDVKALQDEAVKLHASLDGH